MIGVCVECGKRFEINENENLSDYQCSCGGRLLNGLEDSEFKRINNEKGPIIPKSTNLIECPDCGKKLAIKSVYASIVVFQLNTFSDPMARS